LNYKARDLNKQQHSEFEIPALTAGVENQGLAYYVPKDNATILNNVISVSANGANTGRMFYQPHNFTVLQDSYAIEFIKDKISSKSYLYLLACLNKTISNRYDWSNKAGWNRIKDEPIILPTINNDICFEYMGKYIEELEAERIEELEAYLQVTGLSDYKITKKEEEVLDKYYSMAQNSRAEQSRAIMTFNSKELFGDATRGKRLKSADRIHGDLPFITAGESKTGISDYIGNDVQIFNLNTITIDMFGSAKYRNFKYGADDHVAVINTSKYNLNVGLFLTTAYNKTANTGAFSYARNFYAKDADNLNLSLPACENKTPDYRFMEQIIKIIKKQYIKKIMKYLQFKTEITKNVVRN